MILLLCYHIVASYHCSMYELREIDLTEFRRIVFKVVFRCPFRQSAAAEVISLQFESDSWGERLDSYGQHIQSQYILILYTFSH